MTGKIHVRGTALRLDGSGFAIEWAEGQSNVYLEKDGTLFLMYGRGDFEALTRRAYAYADGVNGHYEIAHSVPTYADMDAEFERVVARGAVPVLPPEDETWGQRTCYVADPEGNLVEIGSFNRVEGGQSFRFFRLTGRCARDSMEQSCYYSKHFPSPPF